MYAWSLGVHGWLHAVKICEIDVADNCSVNSRFSNIYCIVGFDCDVCVSIGVKLFNTAVHR